MKRWKLLLLTILICIICTGCNSILGNEYQVPDFFEPVEEETTSSQQISDGEDLETENTLSPSSAQSSDYQVEALEEIEDAAADAGDEAYALKKRETLGLTEEAFANQKAQHSGLYGFSHMGTAYEKLYIEIFTILDARETNVMVSSLDPNEIDYVFQCVLNDHPELFYIKGYTYIQYTIDDIVQRLSFSGSYTMTSAEISQYQATIDTYANNCINSYSGSGDDYTKVKYIYEYLINHTVYNLAAPENQNISSVFVYGESVCQGYAKAMQYLLNKMGVATTIVIGFVENGEGHAWNLVLVNGAYYYVDATWGDAYYEFSDTEVQQNATVISNINYDYLCVTTTQITKTHSIDNVVEMPICSSMEANYYVKENAYFYQYDEALLQSLFDKARSTGSNYVTFKCLDAQVYEAMKSELLTNQKIFQFIGQDNTSVSYTENEAEYTLSFWLS